MSGRWALLFQDYIISNNEKLYNDNESSSALINLFDNPLFRIRITM